MPVLGIFALSRWFNDFHKKEEKLKALKNATLIVGGLATLFLIGHSFLFDFKGAVDENAPKALADAFVADRKSLFVSDTIRTLVLVLLSAGVLYYFLKEKLSEIALVIAFAVLILFDLVSVDRQYVNTENFIAARRVDKPYQATSADKVILKDKEYFRVFDASQEGQRKPARAAYFHNSLSGYHAAKLNRFDALLNFHIYRSNPEVLNMLNTKYVIVGDESGRVEASTRYTQPNGNAWFVGELKVVDTGNEEVLALDSLNTKSTAVINTSLFNEFGLKNKYNTDSTATIKLLSHKPNHLKYQSENTNDGLAVFSELYYYKGWNAYIDGKLIPHLRVNYALRALEIPAGKHSVEFKFEPKVVKTGSKITLGSSVLFTVLLLLGIGFQFKRKKTTS